MLTVKQRQKYYKKLGLYKGSIDGKEGAGTKAANKFFNITFLNLNNDKYNAKTDTLLKKVYKSYCKSKYMKKDDWALFPNFKEEEFKCTCNGKYCDGYNGRKAKCYMRLIMVAQYLRNYYDKILTISSGVRCKKRNQQVGGVKNSKHLVFKALDGSIKGVAAIDVVKLLKKLPIVDYTYDITKSYFHVNV